MTWNPLLWKWSEDYDTPAKRKKKGLRFGDLTGDFSSKGDHPAIGAANIDGFCRALDDQFGSDETERPFVVERYAKCVVVNYPNSSRLTVVPQVAKIGRQFGLNASEF
jgi:hypothetical protein